jgi:hydrogen cyanide synthase HcnA
MSTVRRINENHDGATEQRPNDLCSLPCDINVTVDGTEVPARSGETILALLFAIGRKAIAKSDRKVVSGAYCGMGVCFCCTVEVNGVPKVRACKAKIANGMDIRTKINLNDSLQEVVKK